jgi:hypothetical protein
MQSRIVILRDLIVSEEQFRHRCYRCKLFSKYLYGIQALSWKNITYSYNQVFLRLLQNLNIHHTALLWTTSRCRQFSPHSPSLFPSGQLQHYLIICAYILQVVHIPLRICFQNSSCIFHFTHIWYMLWFSKTPCIDFITKIVFACTPSYELVIKVFLHFTAAEVTGRTAAPSYVNRLIFKM